MRTIILILLCLSLTSKVKAQSQYAYTAFNGTKYSMRAFEKKNIVLLIPSDYEIQNEIAIDTIAKRADRMYDYYKLTMGFEPSGGISAFSNKASVAFVNETCGAACGLIGTKGIEIGLSYLSSLQNNVLQRKRGNNLGLISYEFGRNFYTPLISSKLSFPNNGSVMSNGFATYLGLKAEKYAKANEIEAGIVGANYFYNLLYNGTLSYLVNPKMKAEDFFTHKDSHFPDPNRAYDVVYQGASFLVFTDSVLVNKNPFPKFWTFLKEQPNASKNQDVLDNLAVSISLATGFNLTNYFNGVLKFNLSASAISKISNLPIIADYKLIKDIKNYEIMDLNQDIFALTATLGHQTPELSYKATVKRNGHICFEDTTKKAFIRLPVAKCFSPCENLNDRLLTVYSVLNDTKIDSIHLKLHYRDTISTNQSFQYFIDNSYFSSYNGTGWAETNSVENTIKICSQGTKLDDNRVEFPFKAIKDRIYTFSAKVRTSNKARALISYQGGIGSHYTTPLTTSDTTSWVKISYSFNTNMFDTTSFSNNGVLKFNLCQGNDAGVGQQFAYFKDVELIDVTASFVEWNKTPTQPVITFDGGHLKSSYTSGNQWFFNDKIISGATNQSYLPDKTGKYSVSAIQGLCISDVSNPYNFILTSVTDPNVANKIFIYPNPSNGIFKIEGLTTNQKNAISIYNIDGRLIRKLISNSITETIDLSGQGSGVYLLLINNQPFKILKE